MIQRRLLRVAQIREDGARRRHRQIALRQSAPVQRQQPEVIFQKLPGVIRRKGPRLHRRLHPASLHRVARVAGRQQLPHVELLQRRRYLHAIQFRRPEFARGDVYVREPRPLTLERRRRQVVVLVRPQQRALRHRARGDDARDLAPHDLLREPRVLHLIADGNAVALLDQPRNVALRRVRRHPTHRHRLAFLLVARGERDLQLARSSHRVREKEFVKIAQPEKQQRVRRLLLRRMVLPHQRRRRFSSHLPIVGHGHALPDAGPTRISRAA